ncbi:MAG: Trp biosynthesis-associated membrane protein [Nigerium sp.]|nr:Trp biosynthesis-associated membrane protein [Nigerium sp.]
MRLDPRLAMLLAGLAGLIAGGQHWWIVTWSFESAGGSVGIGGHAGTGGLSSALPGFVLAALLLTLTLAARGRRVVGVLTALAGAGMIAAGLTVPTPSEAVVMQADLGLGIVGQWTADATFVPVVYALCGLLVVAASVWLVARPPAPRARGNAGARQDVTSALDSWKAMDDGRDPTDDERDGA